jgi:FkbM family methyltransferase
MMRKLHDLRQGLRDLFKFDHLPHLLSQRLLGRGSGWTVYRKGSLCFLVDHSAGDQNGTRDCLSQPMYRDLLRQMRLPKALRVLDLGANGGGFPLLCLDEGHDLTALACVEVNPWTFSRLAVNVTHNVGPHARLMNVAIGGHERPLSLRLPRGGTGHSIYEGSGDGDEVSVRVRSFDDLYGEAFGSAPVDVCKMDVEGAEYETVLEGPVECLCKVHHLIIEIHEAPAERQQALRRRLEALGLKHVMTSPAHDDVHLFTNESWETGHAT